MWHCSHDMNSMLTKNHIAQGGRTCILWFNCCLLLAHKVVLVIPCSSEYGRALSSRQGRIMHPEPSISSQRTSSQFQTPEANPSDFTPIITPHSPLSPSLYSESSLFRTTFIKSPKIIFPWCPLSLGYARNAWLVISKVCLYVLPSWL